MLATSALIVIVGAQSARAADQSPAPRLPTKTRRPQSTTGPAAISAATGGGGAISDQLIAGGNLDDIGTNANFLHGGGAFGGGQIGCNYQSGNFVFGLEGEA